MGRNLLRRTSLVFYLCWTVAAPPLLRALPDEIPASSQFDDRSLRRSRAAVFTTAKLPTAVLPSRQTHEGPMVFPVEVPEEPSLSRYLAEYGSPAGLRWIQASLDRGAPFRSFIVSRLQAAHLPPELYYLAMIESTFAVHAVSHSGAVGMWQFMKNSIGDRMTVNEWVDERRDFWKSTEAAVEKLALNYRSLGDWLLAIAAYNGGLGYVSRLVEKTGIHDFWKLARGGFLTAETANYVPKFLAVAAIADYAGRNGLRLSWDPPTEWVEVAAHAPVDLSLLAAQAGIPVAVLRTANAALNYGVTPPGGYRIRVPARYAASAREALASSSINLVRVYRHTVRTGDTFWALSLRYQVPVGLLQRFNPTIDPDSLPQGGQILVPVLAGVPDPAELDSEAANPARPAGASGSYTVSRGDTLWSISRAYGITAEALAAANRMTLNDVLAVGRTLNVPSQASEK